MVVGLLKRLRGMSHKQMGKSGSPSTFEYALDDYVGTYTNEGYGNITLCSSEDSSPNEYCAVVLRDFAIAGRGRGQPDKPQLLAHWPRVWFSHLRIVPEIIDDTNEKFSIFDSTLFTEGYGNDKSPFEYYTLGGVTQVVRVDRTEKDGIKRVSGFTICGISGRPGTYGDNCEKFGAGQDVHEGWLVRFTKVES